MIVSTYSNNASEINEFDGNGNGQELNIPEIIINEVIPYP